MNPTLSACTEEVEDSRKGSDAIVSQPGSDPIPSTINDDQESESSEYESVGSEDIQRDDLINPFWMEDKGLMDGKRGRLSTHEIHFWQEMILKYLESFVKPFTSFEEKLEREERQEKQQSMLKELRNQIVYSFFMLNAIFVLVVFLLQQEKDTLFIQWPLGAKPNITYSGPKNPTVNVAYDYLKLEPIGLIFVVFFAIVLIIQVIGMLFHRWATISHIISTTKLDFFSRSGKVKIRL